MKKYYISIEGNQTGPFALDEIKVMNLSDNDLIWSEDMPAWVKTSELYILKGFVKITPPPLPDKKFAELKAINNALTDSLLPFGLILLISFIASDGSKGFQEYGFDVKDYALYGSLIIAIIPSLIFLLIDYRFRVRCEITKLNL